jgi:hypothetical protein
MFQIVVTPQGTDRRESSPAKIAAEIAVFRGHPLFPFLASWLMCVLLSNAFSKIVDRLVLAPAPGAQLKLRRVCAVERIKFDSERIHSLS